MNANKKTYDIEDEILDDSYERLLTANPEKVNLTLNQIKEYALSNRGDLIAAKKKIEAKQNNLKVVKSKLIPDLEFSGGYAFQSSGMSAFGEHISGAYVGADLVNIPLIYHYQPEIKNAIYEIEQAQLEYNDIEIDVTRNVINAWEIYSIARENLIFYNNTLLPNSKELQVASRDSLMKKEIDLTSYLVSKKIYLELILNYQEALCDYYISYASLLREMGVSSNKIENM